MDGSNKFLTRSRVALRTTHAKPEAAPTSAAYVHPYNVLLPPPFTQKPLRGQDGALLARAGGFLGGAGVAVRYG